MIIEKIIALCYNLYVNKNIPTYNLEEIKELIESGNYIITELAMENAVNDFNFTKDHEILEVIFQLSDSDLYKTMPSTQKVDLWQDVYHKQVRNIGNAYIKLQINKRIKAVIIQFKKQ